MFFVPYIFYNTFGGITYLCVRANAWVSLILFLIKLNQIFQAYSNSIVLCLNFSYMCTISRVHVKTTKIHQHHVRQNRVTNSRLSIDLPTYTFSKADDHVHHHRCNTRSFHFIAAIVASSSYIFDQLFKSVECRGKCMYLLRAPPIIPRKVIVRACDRAHVHQTITWVTIDLLFIAAGSLPM